MKQAFKQVFDSDLEKEDECFKNIAPENWQEKYKPALFKRLLCRLGFLIDESEPAFE